MRRPLDLPLNRTVLLLVDLQEEHRGDPRYLVHDYDKVLDAAGQVLAAARRAGLPVVHAAFVRDFALVPRRRFEPVGEAGEPVFSSPASGLTAICAEVRPRPGERVVLKNNFSCFSDAAFLAEIARLAPEWLIVCGVWTEACIAATVRDATAAGIRVLLVKDACGSGTEAMHQTAILNLANRLYGGAVVGASDAGQLVGGLSADAWHVCGAAPLRFTAESIATDYASL